MGRVPFIQVLKHQKGGTLNDNMVILGYLKDENDSRTFEVSEFTAMIASFFHGIACAFNLQSSLPKDARRQNLYKQLFEPQ